MNKYLKRAKWWMFVVYLSSKWIFKINLGDRVWYNGKIYVVLNGVREDMWRLADLPNGDTGWVKRNECRKVWTLKNMIDNFRSGYRFYMGYWFSIWVNVGIENWMRKCKIWG